MNRSQQGRAVRLYVSLAALGLLLLFLWPSFVAAVPLTAKHELQRSWRYASDVGSYSYRSTMVRTKHPTLSLENVGRTAKVERASAQGSVDNPDETIQLTLWSVGIEQDGVDIKLEEGQSYARRSGGDEWTAIDQPATDFAPGGDPLGFLLAAENIQQLPDSARPAAEDGLQSIVYSSGGAETGYRFDIDGVKYADHMRLQMQQSMREQGELPASITLGPIAQYVNMEATGEIWLDKSGLPVKQIITMKFAPERGAQHWTEQQIITGFSSWDTAIAAHHLYVLVPRLLEEPSLLISDPLSLLPNPQYALFSIDERDVQEAGMMLSLLLLSAALLTLIIAQRRSPRFYAVLSLTIIVAMVVTPLLNMGQVSAYYARQETRQAEQQQQIEEQEQLEELKNQQMGGNFNPHRNPLTAQDVDPNAIAMASNAPTHRITLPATVQSTLPTPARALNCTLAEGSDCDGDGLTDDVELYELGTDPEDVDTDDDNISDKTEVEGFTQNGTDWYLDPSNPDSNGDGTLDGVACPELVDVVQGVLGTPTGSTCLNTDSDDVPDVFDFDDDADGVPDFSDSSRLTVAGPYNDTTEAFNFNIDLNQNGEPIFVDFEIRPTTPDHLYYTRNVLDWPDNDTKGQWTKNTSTTLADLGEDVTDDGDMILNPLLEIEITYDANNPTAGLPVDAGFSASAATIPDYSDLTWIDTEELDQWSIALNEGSTSDKLLLWIPLNVVAERIGDTPVGWSGRMQYVPQLSQTVLGNDQRIRMIWMIQGVKDTCSPPEDADYETYCADSANWTSTIDIMQTYYEDFYLTGLTVREDHGAKLHVIAEPSTAGNANYEDYLWHLADQLQDTFVRGEQNSDGSRFDVDDIPTYAANWGLTGLDYTTSTLADHSEFAQLAEDNLSILNRVFSSASVGDRTTLMTAGEEVARVATLNDDATTIDNSSVSVDLTSVDKATGTVVRFSPFVYEGASVWTDDTLENYQNVLAVDLANVFSNSELDTLISPSGETISDYDLVQDGAISLAQGFYLAVYVGIGATVELNDVSSNSDTVPDSGLVLSGEPVTNIVQHMLQEAQAFYAENSVVAALAGASDSYAANALSAAFATSQLAFLEALGAARQGDVTTSLTLALQELGDYYKVSDIDTTKFTDYASLSQQIHISGATSISDSYGQGWSIAYYAAKVLYNLYYVKWGLSFALGTAATIAKSASIFTKLWNSAKFWAVVGFIFQVGVALIIFLTGDYDNQLEYNAAAVQFAFTVIVAFILALITLIPVVGFLIVAVIALIDALVALICAAVGVEPGSAVDTWVCNGITGAVIRALSLLFSDQLVTVDLDKDDRLQVSFFTPEIDPSSGTDGYVQGNKLDISARVTNTLSLNEPKVGENLIILTSFSNSRLREIMRESTFSYHLQANKIDHSDDLDLGDASRWSNNNDQMVFDVTGEGEFNNAGINKSTDLYLTESFNVAGLDCGGFIGASEATCNVYDVRDVAHSFIGGQFALDIFPKDLDGFYSLATVGNNGGYRLSWDGGFPTLADADGDGLRSKAQGGNDPDDSDPDFDDDGLNDFWELDNGFDPTLVDSDIDGLNDYWEAFYNTSPYLADTDNDGLIDGDEFFHSNARSALIDDTSTWSGGWLFTYDFNGDTALKTRVSASPIDADTDGDNVTDRLEFVYGYNPKVPQELNILSLIAATDSIVAPSASVAYTATVKNELNSRTARGLLEAEFPVDITQEVQTFVLAQLEETTLNGSVTAPDLSSTTEVSVTIRAGAILEDPMAEDTDANLVAQYQFNENEPDTQCTGGFNNCSGASYDFADSSGNDIDAVCEKDFNGSYGVDCPVANGAFLEFLGVYNSSNSANYWTPVARIEADNAFVLDSFTIEAWVKPDGSQSHRQHILNKYGDITIGINRNSLQPFVEIQHSDCSDGDYDGLFSIDETITEQIGSTINLNQGQWNQIVVTYDDNTDRLTVYINGESGGAITTTSCMSSGLNDRITLGAMDVAGFSSLGNLNWIPPAFSSDSSSLIYGYSNAESFAFVGGLDRLQFFDDVLSTTEIDDLYRNGNRVIDFTFDDPPGATTFTDTSGNELDGTCSTACPESGLPGLSNQAVYFDNSIIAVPATSDTLGLINTSYTVMAWLKGGDYSGSGRYSTLLGTVIGVVHDETTDDGYLALGNFASNQALVVDTPLDTEEWHHVAWRLEYDNTTPANSTRTIFVDGVQVAQDNGEADVLSFFTALPIGLLYKGWLDELLIVRNALSVDEIQSYMNEAPNLSLHLDEDLDTTSFLDESQNQNSATCSGDSCPAAGADGWMREAPVFDGGDLLTVAANSALNVTDFSINLWVKPTNEKNLEQYLIRKSNGSGYNSNYSLSIEPNSLKVGFDIQSSCANANSGFKSISSNGELLENQWNSITATYDNDENEMLLYI
ncbi:MAG: LamG-like jellyroll fold domain-containing protein, partial [Chloroflexota bacterium]